MIKNELLNIIQMFGFVIDFDQYDVKDKYWIRVILKGDSRFDNPEDCVILYADESKEIICAKLRTALINVGKKIKTEEIKNVLND